jgi:hypothetical protein
MSHFTKGKALKPEDVKICVLYDPEDGRIAHHHMVGTFPGGEGSMTRKLNGEHWHGLRALEQTLQSSKHYMFPKKNVTSLIGIRSTSKR